MTTLHRLAQRRRHGPTAAAPRRVRVAGGYHPEVVHAWADEPLQLVFRREESASCSERVVFPAFGKSAMLPEYEDVIVELPPAPPGVYEFTCQMGMLHGRVVLEQRR